MRLPTLPSALRLSAGVLLLSGLACGDSTGPAPPALVIVTDALPEAVVGVAYSESLVATGGSGSTTWSIRSGTLPTGLQLSPEGSISGTATSSATRTLTVAATSGDQTTTKEIDFSVVQPLRIASTSLPTGSPGASYSVTLRASGGTGSYTWSVASGTLPDGLALDPSGTLSGTPTEPGTATFVLGVASGTQSESVSLELRILQAVEITTSALPDGRVGRDYLPHQLLATGGTGTYGWSISSGRLPEGMRLSGTGELSGIPIAAGVSDVTVQVVSGSLNASRELRLTVRDTVQVRTTSLPIGVLGVDYEVDLQADGGDGSYGWSLVSGALPDGFALDASGRLSGTPTATGSFTFVVEVRSEDESASRSLVLVVQDPVSITTATLPPASLEQAYFAEIQAVDGNDSYAFAVVGGALPGGMSLDGERGRILGTPTEEGTFAFTVEVASGGTTARADLSIAVAAAGCFPTSPDSDGDRLPDCAETGTGFFIDATNTGTSATEPDTDDDGIPDGDEVLGTTQGLDLPAMGLHPLRKNILIEHDWFDDSEGGSLHSHRPSAATIEMVRAVFAAAPVTNPDGTTGIVVIQDYGQGGPFTGGGLVSDSDGCLASGVGGTEYTSHRASNFAANRINYFHYNLIVHRYGADAIGSCDGSSGSSGQAFYIDSRLMVASSTWHSRAGSGDQWVANTIVHELGHNLGLSHGGDLNSAQSGYNYKPNYPSVMNYRYQFPGVDTDCDITADGFLDYSHGTRLSLDEGAVDETQGICVGVPIDWNRDGDATDSGFIQDLQAYLGGEGNDSATDVLHDWNDWDNLYIAESVEPRGVPGGARLLRVAEQCAPPPIPDGG